jgi:hypothetical protein
VIRAGLLTLALALAMVPAAAYGSGQSQTTRAMIDSGHAGAVRWLEFDDKRGLLFSSGDDGTVRIWDPVAGNLLRTLQVTQLRTGRIAASPSASRLAVVVTDGSGSSSLAVWDWDQERQLFRIPLKEEPLFLRFSPLGTYLLYGESSWQGLKIVRAEDGSPVSFHPEGFGSVGFAEMSRSEKTMMTYEVSGRITYWDLESGSQTQEAATVPYLSGIRISRDRGVLVGATSSEIVRVDAVSGAVRGRAPVTGTASLDLSPAGDEITAILAPGMPPASWSVVGDSLAPAPAPPSLPSPPTLLAYGSSALYFADAFGGLSALTASGDVASFGKNAVAPLTGFDVGEGRMALASRDWIRVLSIDGLGGSVPPSVIHTLLAPNPFSDAAGLAFLDANRLLAWKSGNGAPGFSLIDTASLGTAGAAAPAFVPLPSAFRAPLSDLRASANELIGVESGGTLRIADPLTGTSRFDLRITGAVAATRVSAGELVAARNTAGASQGSLIRLNLSTGETVTIRDRNLFTYALLLDPGTAGQGPALYSIGIDAANATNFVRHDGPGFDRETLLDSVGEEELDASLSFDPDQHLVFATLGQDRVVSWDGRSLKAITLQNTVPLRLVVRSGLAFSLNKDSTITIADAATGARKAQVALFQDGEWCIVFADGHYAASTGGDLHVRVFSDGNPVKATEDYRLRIDTR